MSARAKMYLLPRHIISHVVISPNHKIRAFERLPNSSGLTTAAFKERVIKTNNASNTDHKPGDIVSPVCSQDTVALRGAIKRRRQGGLEPNLFGKLSAECLVLEAGWIGQAVTVHLSGQEDTELHHLLQHSGGGRLHGNVIVQLCNRKEWYSS